MKVIGKGSSTIELNNFIFIPSQSGKGCVVCSVGVCVCFFFIENVFIVSLGLWQPKTESLGEQQQKKHWNHEPNVFKRVLSG